MTDFLRAGDMETAAALNRADVAVLAGERASLLAIKAVMKYRDYCRQPPFEAATDIDRERAERWRAHIHGTATLDEATSMALIADYGVPGPALEVIENEAALLKAAETIGYPVVLKTAMPGVTPNLTWTASG